MEKEKITFEEFEQLQKKLEIKVGLIVSVEEIPKSKKLIKLTVAFGRMEDGLAILKTVVTNIKSDLQVKYGNGETKFDQAMFDTLFKGQNMLFITNLKPVEMMGIESSAMICPGELDKYHLATVNGNEMLGNTIL